MRITLRTAGLPPISSCRNCKFNGSGSRGIFAQNPVHAAWRAPCLSRLTGPVFTPLGGPSVFAAWRAQCFRRLAGPVFSPLGGPSVYAAWQAQCFRRLAGPVFIPLGGPSVYPAWRAQCLSRLAGLVFSPFGGPSVFAAWRGQCLSRLTGPVFTPLDGPSVFAAWRAQCFRRLAVHRGFVCGYKFCSNIMISSPAAGGGCGVARCPDRLGAGGHQAAIAVGRYRRRVFARQVAGGRGSCAGCQHLWQR